MGNSATQGAAPASIPAMQDAATNAMNLQNLKEQKIAQIVGQGLAGAGNTIGQGMQGKAIPQVRAPQMNPVKFGGSAQSDPLADMYKIYLAEQNANRV